MARKGSDQTESMTSSQGKFGGGESNEESGIYGHLIWWRWPKSTTVRPGSYRKKYASMENYALSRL